MLFRSGKTPCPSILGPATHSDEQQEKAASPPQQPNQQHLAARPSHHRTKLSRSSPPPRTESPTQICSERQNSTGPSPESATSPTRRSEAGRPLFQTAPPRPPQTRRPRGNLSCRNRTYYLHAREEPGSPHLPTPAGARRPRRTPAFPAETTQTRFRLSFAYPEERRKVETTC